jgi:hypothetical protein
MTDVPVRRKKEVKAMEKSIVRDRAICPQKKQRYQNPRQLQRWILGESYLIEGDLDVVQTQVVGGHHEHIDDSQRQDLACLVQVELQADGRERTRQPWPPAATNSRKQRG